MGLDSGIYMGTVNCYIGFIDKTIVIIYRLNDGVMAVNIKQVIKGTGRKLRWFANFNISLYLQIILKY